MLATGGPWVETRLLERALRRGPFRLASTGARCFGLRTTIVGMDQGNEHVGTDGPDLIVMRGGHDEALRVLKAARRFGR